ncbi:MAG: hypothetical protein ACXV3F_16920 [Frankiaceae bacterium]
MGCTAGALTDDVNPNRLLGPAFTPLVSLAVAVPPLRRRTGAEPARVKEHTRRIVIRLISVAMLVTWVAAGLTAAWLLDVSTGAAVMIGVILGRAFALVGGRVVRTQCAGGPAGGPGASRAAGPPTEI